MTSIFLTACQFHRRLCTHRSDDNDSATPIALALSLRGLFVTITPRISRTAMVSGHNENQRQDGNDDDNGELEHSGIHIRTLLFAARSDTFHLTLELHLRFMIPDPPSDARLDIVKSVCGILQNQLKQLQFLRLDIGHRDPGEVEIQRLLNACPASALQHLDLSMLYSVFSGVLGHIAHLKFPRLHCLDLSHCEHVNDSALKHVGMLVSLRSLNLSGCCDGVTDVGLGHLRPLVNLESLDLSACGSISDAGLAHISCLPSLRKLLLVSCENITDVGLQHLVGNGELHLEVLNVADCSQITDAGVQLVVAVFASTLQSLNLRDCEKLTDVTVRKIGSCSKDTLRHLRLDGCFKITTNNGVRELSQMRALHSLRLRRLAIHFTEEGWAQFCTEVASHASLRVLDVTYSDNLTDDAVVHIGKLTMLTSLHLSGCSKITDRSLMHLRGLTQLKQLHLFCCEEITDAGLEHIPGLVAMEHLNLAYCSKITDAGMRNLSDMKLLQVLDLEGCEKITDSSLEQVVGRNMRCLRKVTLMDTGTTRSGRAALKRAIRDLFVVVNDDEE